MIARKAAGVLGGIPFWMGPSQFYSYSAYGVQPIPCSIWDVIFQNLNTGIDPTTGVSNLQKIRCAVNSRFGEIQWFYPSANGSGECDSYAKFNAYLNQGAGAWDYGTLGRTAWVDQSCLGHPSGLIHPRSIFISMKLQMTLTVKPWANFSDWIFHYLRGRFYFVRRLDMD